MDLVTSDDVNLCGFPVNQNDLNHDYLCLIVQAIKITCVLYTSLS